MMTTGLAQRTVAAAIILLAGVFGAAAVKTAHSGPARVYTSDATNAAQDVTWGG
jgi:hypothetical protein